MALITLNKVSFRYGANVLLQEADMQISQGDAMALIGRNGCGKSTLLKMIAGINEPDSGFIERANGISAAYLPQDVPSNLKGSVYDAVASGFGENGADLMRLHRLMKTVAGAHSKEQQDELDSLIHKFDSMGYWEMDTKIKEIIERLELSPELETADISAGLKRRVLLGKELVSNPDILLLDEPTNHLDIDSVLWLEKFLKTCGKTLVFVSHDRTFLKNLASRVVEVDRGKLIAFDCQFDEFLRRRDDYLEAQERKEMEFDKKLAKEEAWLRRGIRARRTRNEGRVKELMRLRKVRADRRDKKGGLSLNIQESSAGGEKVMDVKSISVAYSENPIIKDFSTTIYRGDKIGIIGRNGVGKTTLLNALLGNIKLSEGKVEMGTRLKISYFDQLRQKLNPRMRPFDFVGEGSDFVSVGEQKQNVLSYLQDFLFEPEQIMGEIAMLSGGEKNRLMLAKLLSSPANVLVLDEPTNDLDMQTIDILESALVGFSGTILLVSHDRSFLNNIVNGVFYFDGDAQIKELVGGYDEWDSIRTKKILQEEKPRVKFVQTKRRDKFTNNERRDLEEIPARIDALEIEKSEIAAKLSDNDFVKEHFDQLTSLNARLEEISKLDEELFERWSSLEERRLEMESD